MTLKALKANTDEQFFMEYFSSTEQLKDPNNHAVPLLEVINLPEELWWTHEEGIFSVLIIMPRLRMIYTPPFHCLSEFIEAFQQFLEVSQTCDFHNPLDLPRLTRLRALNSCIATISLTGGCSFSTIIATRNPFNLRLQGCM